MMMNKRILIACEYTGVVREAFAAKGWDAWSCDILPSEIPGQHIQDDVLNHLGDGWDMMIAHPPCTDLAVSGARWWKNKQESQQAAADFFMELASANISKIAVENPIGFMSKYYRKPDQIVQPWWFGDPYTKSTCLWLTGLPLLVKTNEVDHGKIVIHGGRRIPEWYSNNKKMRDRTFPGLAKAMADQWGGSNAT